MKDNKEIITHGASFKKTFLAKRNQPPSFVERFDSMNRIEREFFSIYGKIPTKVEIEQYKRNIKRDKALNS